MNNQNSHDNNQQSENVQPDVTPDSTASEQSTVWPMDKPGLEAQLRSLEQERDWLYLLLDHSRDAIYFKDLNSKYLRISRCHPAMQYYSETEEAIGKSDFDIFPIEHAQEAYDDEMRIIATGEPILGIIERETAPGMPEKWVFTSKMPIRDKNGKTTGTFGISRDITQIKQYENELQKAKDELEERVRERTKELQTTNEALERRIGQLDFLTAASYEMAQHVGICELGNAILEVFSSRLKVSTAAVFQFSDNKYTRVSAIGALADAAYKDAVEAAILQLNLSRITAPEVVRKWGDIVPEAAPWTDLSEYPGCIAVPLLADNRSVGMLLLFSGTDTEQLLQEERNVILTLAAQAAVCMSNALYYLELDEKAHLEGELQAARSIQQRLTPNKKPDIPRISLKGLYSPAYEVGGDYLDYFKNDAGCWVVVIADVCGKGVPAALLMTILRSAFRVEARSQTSAKQLLCAVNDSMQANLDDRSFVTAICLIISPDSSTMSYARAGHPRLIRITADEQRVETLESDGIALGILSDRESFEGTVSEVSVPLHKGERYLIYTDGLTEAFNLQKNTYGISRLHSVLETRMSDTTPEATLNAILKDVKSFTSGAPYHDDLTVIAMEVT
ncbi:MAG: SpoIIE family protein phosphatase [Chitinispirillaceae bacterium]|nr:SpoIIE family protein phosphatase [Chitinispirillaceae bacterium]